MRITQFSLLSKTSIHALRHYEAIDLLVPQRTPRNNYRDYALSQVKEAIFITMSRRVGMSLIAIAQQLPSYRLGTLRPSAMVEALNARRDELDVQIHALQAQRQLVVEHVSWIEERAHRQRPQAGQKTKPWPATPKRRPTPKDR